MSGTENGNGATNGATSSAELEAQETMRKMVLDAVTQGTAFVSGYLAKQVLEQPQFMESLEVVVMKQIQAQPGLAAVLDDILDPTNREKYPVVRAIIHGPEQSVLAAGAVPAPQNRLPGVPPGRVVHAIIDAPKKMAEGGVIDLASIGKLATFLGFLSYPPLRALLSIHGLEVSFQQIGAPVKKTSNLIV